ncbi:MAG: peptidylprolyl isomerase [Gemmatimonadota bacterium]
MALLWPAILLTCVALTACQKADPKTQVVASIGEEEITVEEVAEYMLKGAAGANEAAVQQAVDELIAIELVGLRARARHTLTAAESLQIKEWREQLVLNQFREDVIWKSVQMDEAKLRAWYDENVGEEVRARHILLGVEQTATPAVRQAARQKADSLLQELKDGADFAALAAEHSSDGSAARGGSLGYFARGAMVEPFEKAAFETPVGELVPSVVETQFGYHIIEVEDKRKQPFDELRDSIEEQLAMPGRQQAEQAYITQAMESSGIQFRETNVTRLIILIDADPPRDATPEERQLELATFNAGKIPLGEIWDLYSVLPDANRQAIAALDQTQMIQALSAIAQSRILLARAETAKTALDTTRQRQFDERVDQLYIETYLVEVAQKRLEVSDAEVAQYYAEHREFYRDQPLPVVAEQIRQILMVQRSEELSAPEAREALVKAVADSQAQTAGVTRHEDTYDEVLTVLRAKYEELGQTPPTSSLEETPRAVPTPQPSAPLPPADSAP